MANQDNKNFVDSMLDTQKQMVDTMVENTKKFTNGNAMANDTVQKGSEWYKNWLDGQKSVFSQTADKAGNMTGNMQENMTKMNEFYQNWFNTQMNWAKQMWEMNLNHMKTAQNNTTATDPMSQWTNSWNNAMSNWNTWTNNMNQAANWMNMMNQFQSMNPMNADAWKNAYGNWTGIFNQYYEMLNGNFAKWQENMQNGTTQDAYRNMINAAEGFTRFNEMWMPMWKSIQEKTFNSEVYKQWMNPGQYKELMDKYFGFMPDGSREYMQNMTNMMQNGMQQMGQNGMNGYQQMRSMMNNMMPMPGAEMFGNMMNGYNTWYNNMNNAISPITKMMSPNQHTKTMMEWQDIANRLAIFNIKNAEMQYMIYNQGTKVMDNLAENIMNKIAKGEEVNSVMALYQEWMNLSDKTFVSYFESDEYSQLMAEVSAMQMRLRKDIEGQMEKFMVGLPVATRSEMDELYKTIYELKKQVREMSKANDNETDEEEKTTRRKKA